MPIIGRFKNLFRGNTITAVKRPLPDVIKYDVDPFSEWKVLGELGDGAFGTVQKVCNVNDSKRLAAAKCITIEPDEDVEDMSIEIAILSSCDHPNIVHLLDAYFYDNSLCMMLEFCAGGAVSDIMQELLKPLNEPQIAYVTHYVCDALSYLHSSFILHRDLKAGNILLAGDGTVKLADFGVSAKMKDANERRNSFIGSPYWMAPEVMFCETFKDQPYDCLADIWSLGITLIEMAQMDPPNYQISAMRIVIKVQKSDPPKLDRPAKWTPLFNSFLEYCLKKNPSERCTAEQLKSHPFIKDARNPRPIIALLCEKNADVQEEVIIADDAESVDGSVGGSVMTGDFESGDELCNKQAANQIEMNVDVENRVPLRDANGNSDVKQLPRKKFAAPSPPDNDKTPQATNFVVQMKNVDALKELTIENPNSPTPYTNRNISPGKEAIEILDDLYNALDNDYADGTASSSSSPRRPHEQTPKTNIEDANGPSHMIRDLSAEFASSANSTPRANSHSWKDDFNQVRVSELAANFNVRQPAQSSRNSTPQLQRTTLELRSETTETPSRHASKMHRHSSPASSDHQPTNSSHSSSSTDHSIQHQSNHSDSGVETHESTSVVPPPPEPPIDYEVQAAKTKNQRSVPASKQVESTPKRRISDESTVSLSQTPSVTMSPVINGRHKTPTIVAQNPNGSLLTRSAPNRATVTRKTRTYVVDGVEVTSTTLHVLSAQQDYALRRKELQELKRLQRREARDQQLLNERNENDCDIQERKYNEYRSTIIRDYDAEREQLQKMQKKKMEELERIQEDERRACAKNIKSIQEKEYREFQLLLRDEMKRLKYEVDVLPRAQRKEAYKHRRERLEMIHADQERKFIASKRTASETIKEKLQRSHEENLARLDRQFLNELHDLRRNVESALWEQERAQMNDRFNLRRQQLKDNFALQRSLMITRHRMEIDRIRKTHQANEDLLLRSLAMSRKQLPKALRSESKTRTVIFRESLRINYPDESPHMWSQRIHDFEEGEKLRIKQKIEEYDHKCRRRLQELRESNAAAEAELEEIHHAKTDIIMKNEAQKIAEYENEYELLVASWEQDLPQRKRDLEDQLRKELEEQDRFYKAGVNMIDGHPMT
ncbi:Protein kinase domain-containing protein [Aphelenchoides besseyi]|nr:Protein kinase domain-containing protein [Aphelenchoides besseyi]